MINSAMIVLLAFFFFSSRLAAVEYLKEDKPSQSGCAAGTQILQQENGPFAFMLNCEDSLGDYLSLLYYAPMDGASVGAWSIDNRVWRKQSWGNGFVNLLWHGKNTVYVATESITGEAGIFKINILDKQSKLISKPAKDFEGYFVIKGVSGKFLEFIEKTIDGKERLTKVRL